MRILRIFGIVVAVHLTAFVFVFAIPGCRSTTRRASSEKPVVESTTQTLRFPGTKPAEYEPSPFATLPPSPAAAETSGSLGGSTIVFPGAASQSPTRPAPGSPSASSAPSSPSGPTHTVVARESLWSIAKKHGVSEKELAAANQLRTGAILRVGQVLKLPVPPEAKPGESVSVPASTFTYRVRAGDSLVSISKRAGITTAQLKELNQLTSDRVRVGQELVLPATPAAIPSGDGVAPEAPVATKTSKPPKPGMTRHVVRSGETLGEIARKYGVPLSTIATVNHIANPAALRAGAELWIPAPSQKSSATTSSAATPTASAPAPTPTPATPSPTPTPTPAESSPFVTPSTEQESPISPAEQSPVTGGSDDWVTPGRN